MSKNTKNQQAASTLKQLKEVPGLFTCLLEHKVNSTTAQTKWLGPPIPPEEWHKVLAFFQWTNDTAHSESQVRSYVNPQLRTWKFWAYPQEANTGMTAKELEDNPGFKEQRLQFPASEGWLYFGTVHHHCSGSAFQSGTDQHNEQKQDGLHITVGNMNSNTYSLHERLYLGAINDHRHLIDHDLSWFWDVGDAMADVPEWAARLLPADIRDRIARGQMCEKPPEGTTFPQQWKDNVIHKPVVVISTPSYQGGLGYNPNAVFHSTFQRKVTNLPFDLRIAREQFTKLCSDMKIGEADGLAEMQAILQSDQFSVELISLMYRNDVSLQALADFIEDDMIEPSGPAKSDQGIPDWDGSGYGHMMK